MSIKNDRYETVIIFQIFVLCTRQCFSVFAFRNTRQPLFDPMSLMQVQV